MTVNWPFSEDTKKIRSISSIQHKIVTRVDLIVKNDDF